MRTAAALPLLLAMTALGCAPEVGDACQVAAECASGQSCDTTVPDGYCLAYDCETSGDCPGDAVCVDFGGFTACMKACSANGDCREGGYECRADLAGPAYCYMPPEGSG
jgi:hypothetical protein